jgi:hypothetical protein
MDQSAERIGLTNQSRRLAYGAEYQPDAYMNGRHRPHDRIYAAFVSRRCQELHLGDGLLSDALSLSVLPPKEWRIWLRALIMPATSAAQIMV